MNRHSVDTSTAGSQRKNTKGAQPKNGGVSRRSRGAGDKRERILDAAVEVFAENGFFHAKIAQVAEKAGVADGTIYLYFKNKDDLLISLFEDRMERVLQTIRAALAEKQTPREKIAQFIVTHFALVAANRAQSAVLTVELRQSAKFIKSAQNPHFAAFLKLLASVIEEGQASGDFRASLKPQLVARALFGALDELALWWVLRSATPGELTQAASQVADLFLAGMIPPAETQIASRKTSQARITSK